MANTKQAWLRSVGGKAPCEEICAPCGAQARTETYEACSRRFCPGNVALHEIRKLQKYTELLIRKSPFRILFAKSP